MMRLEKGFKAMTSEESAEEPQTITVGRGEGLTDIPLICIPESSWARRIQLVPQGAKVCDRWEGPVSRYAP